MSKQKEPVAEPTVLQQLAEMRANGNEQTIPGTKRKIRLRSVNAKQLLLENKMPDLLTPLVVKSVYQELNDDQVCSFLNKDGVDVKDALAMIEVLEFVAKRSIVDGTPVEDLTHGELQWIFRLVMGPAELLVTFRYEQVFDVEPVDEEQDLQPVAE